MVLENGGNILNIVKNIIDLMFIFFNAMFNIEFDLTDNIKVKLGVLVLSFVTVVYLIYRVFLALKLIGGDGDD